MKDRPRQTGVCSGFGQVGCRVLSVAVPAHSGILRHCLRVWESRDAMLVGFLRLLGDPEMFNVLIIS